MKLAIRGVVFAFLISVFMVIGACSGRVEREQTENTKTATADLLVGPYLVWVAPAGQMSAWRINGTAVTGLTQITNIAVDGGFPQERSFVDSRWNSILFDNTSSPHALWMQFLDGGGALGPLDIVTCTLSACATTPGAILGRTMMQGTEGVMWYEPLSGALTIWQLPALTVTSMTTVSLNCGRSNGCSVRNVPRLVGDFNGDGNSDILWQSNVNGTLSIWLLDSSATYFALQRLSLLCDATCKADGAMPIGTVDLNGDGHLDVTWWDPVTGALTTWLLDGAANVIGTSTLVQTCAVSTCNLRPVGYVSFPSP